MARLVATSVFRGSQQGEGRGGVFLIDLVAQTVRPVLDWNTVNLDWRGRSADSGLRGIAFHDETVYIAASDELFAFDSDFQLQGSWKNRYLKHCQEISVYQGQVFLTSAGFDSILAFDTETRKFHWALSVEPQEFHFTARAFDPLSEDGPLMLNRMDINSVLCNDEGMYLAGLRTGGMLHFNGKTVAMSATLPAGTHNAQPYRGGVLFNDTEANTVRFASPDPGQERVFRVPTFAVNKLTGLEHVADGSARPSFGRGLCVVKDGLVAAGSSPSTVALHDLTSGETALTVTLSTDVRNAIHGLEVWPWK